MKKRYSASEIAKMGLAGLPTSKQAVIARAASEQWPFEEQKGLGGTRRAYEIPARYLQGTGQEAPEADPYEKLDELKQIQQYAGMNDADLLEAIIEGVERWGKDMGEALTPARKATLISLFYRYFREEGAVDQNKLVDMLKKVG